MGILDFTKIASAKEATGEQDTFELFARAFLEHAGYDIIEEPGRGQDGGKDLVVIEKRSGLSGSTNIRWLVSCKHFAHGKKKAVGVDDEISILDRVKAKKCDGFMGFYSTVVSSAFQQRLHELKDEIPTYFYDWGRMEQKLLSTPAWQEFGKTFFPDDIQDYQRRTQFTLTDHLREVQASFSPIKDRYDIQLYSHGAAGAMFLVFVPRQSRTIHMEPLAAEGEELIFPDTEVGAKMRWAYEQFRKKGGSLTLPLSCFRGFDIPDFLKNDLGHDENSWITITTAIESEAFQCRVRLLQNNEECMVLDGIDMKLLGGGEEELRFSNQHQTTPWKIRVQVTFGPDQSITTAISFEVSCVGVNVERALHASRLMDHLSEGVHIIVEDVERGAIIARGDSRYRFDDSLPDGSTSLTPVLEKLAYIQHVTSIHFTIPDEGFSRKDKQNIEEAYTILQTGQLIAPAYRSTTTMILQQGNPQEALKVLSMPYQWVTIRGDNHGRTILGKDVDLGPVEIEMALELSQESMDNLRSAISSNAETAELSLIPREGSERKETYSNWLPKDKEE